MTEYIEREALMKNFCGYDLTKCVKYGNENAEQQHNSYSTMMMYEIADEIMDAPAADVAPVVHGRWENGDPYCPVCGKDKFAGLDADIWADWKPDYCPNCGARMNDA